MISKILKSETVANDFMRNACANAQQAGGRFSINYEYNETWYVVYEIEFGTGAGKVGAEETVAGGVLDGDLREENTSRCTGEGV
jgi:hypothetical protein